MKKEEINQLVEEYRKAILKYQEFAERIEFLLERLLKEGNFKFQVVTSRAKEAESLRKKIVENNLTIKKISDIDDLAGCRIIFYLESDIKRFLEQIKKEFDVIKIESKFSEDEYNAVHAVVQLADSRYSLPEYATFRDLKCEIQMTTVLYHAWSELEHDIIYKPDKQLSEFDKRAFDSLKKHFRDVMKNHIKKAQYTFDHIDEETKKLSLGETIFGPGFLRDILASTSRNELYEKLKILSKYIQDFGDKTPEEMNILEFIDAVLTEAKKMKTKPIKTVLGPLKGNTYADITDVALDIVDYIRYMNVEDTLSMLLMLTRDRNKFVQEKALKVLSNLSKYNYHVIKKANFYPQQIILGELEKLKTDDLLRNFDAVALITKNLLEPSFEGHSMADHNTVTFHVGALPPQEDLKKIRERTILLLINLYKEVRKVMEKKKILSVLQEASRTPMEKYSDQLEQMVADDVAKLIDFYISIVPDERNEILLDIDEQRHWFERRFGKEKSNKYKQLSKLEDLSDVLQARSDYQIFKIFVGANRYFDVDLDWRKAEAIRNKKITEFIGDIDISNEKRWKKIIFNVARSYPNCEPHDFEYFNKFLFLLSQEKPDFVLRHLLDQKAMKPFLELIIPGLWISYRHTDVRSIMEGWIDAGENLGLCASTFYRIDDIDLPLLRKILRQAKKANDYIAITDVLRSAVNNYKRDRQAIKRIIVISIEVLAKARYVNWINYIWYEKNMKYVLNKMNAIEAEQLLLNLTEAKNIDHHLEVVLKPICEKYPIKVIKFFERRVEIAKQEKVEGYDAIPYEFYDLYEALQKKSESVINEILKWFMKKEWIFRWEASHLIKMIFPKFSDVLEKKLIDLMKYGDEADTNSVIMILRAYKGDVFLHNVCKEIVRRYSKNKEMMNEIFIVLSQTGVVSGEYGFVKAYEQKKEEIQAWKKEANKSILQFVKEYEKYLDANIVAEKERADREIEMRKLEFD